MMRDDDEEEARHGRLFCLGSVVDDEDAASED